LGYSDVVFNAAVTDRRDRCVKDAVTGAWVAVTGLPHTADVYNIFVVVAEMKFSVVIVAGVVIGGLGGEDNRNMAVPTESDPRGFLKVFV